MSFLQTAGMLVWPSFSGDKLLDEERRLLADIRPSGVILFRRNLTSLHQAKNLIAEIRELVGADKRNFKFVVSIDEEGGRVSRLPPPFVRGQAPRAFGDAHDLNGLASQVLFQSFVAAGLGINMLLAPVADILTEPHNPAIGDRAFGTTPEIVSECAKVVAKTLAENRILGCAKHFPGHGHTTTDSHHGFATTTVPLATLRSREWVPFRDLINQGVPLCMTAHVVATALDAHKPATLSEIVLQTYLRTELQFQGIIVSDDLRMNAVSDYYNVKRAVVASVTTDITDAERVGKADNDSYLELAAVDALRAGCDVLLSCQSIVAEKRVYEAIARELEKDSTFAQLCQEKVERIVRVLSAP